MNADNLSKYSQKFKNLINFIEGIKPGFLDSVGGGYPVDTICAEFSERKLPEGLVAIFLHVGSNIQARGGVGISTFIPGYNILPFLEIKNQINLYEKAHNEILQKWGEDDWETDMIPFLEDGCGSHYCVRSLKDNQSVYYLDKVEGRSYVCRDLDAFFDMVFEMYKQKAYYIDQDFEVDCDWDLATKIETKYSVQ